MARMTKFKPEGMTDEEVIETLEGAKITFSGYLSPREDTEKVVSIHSISHNDRGRYIKIFTGSHMRFISVDKITKYTKRK